MNIRKLSLSIICVVFALPSLAQMRSLDLKPVADGDLRASTLVTAPSMPLANTSRDAVTFSWPANGLARGARPEPYNAQSRSFTLTVDAAELASGVSVRTDGPGAVLRLSSVGSDLVLNADQLQVVAASGAKMNARAAADQLVNRDDLNAAGMAGASETLGLRLAPAHGAGTFTLVYPGAGDRGQVRIDVLDRNSASVLSVQSTADQFMSAERASVRAQWHDGDAKGRLASIMGYALSPNGQRHDLAFAKDGSAALASSADADFGPGLWEWHVTAIDATGLRRDAKTAFAVSHAVARLDDSAQVDIRADAVVVMLGAQVQSAGRYEVNATLVATDAKGEQVAALIGATANWLEPGTGQLTLRFEADQIKAMGLRAPFALRDLTLRDQSRLSTLETRRDALSF